MPLSDADILQSNSGSFNGSSGDATLSATTAGSGVVLAVTTGGATMVSPPTGFTLVDDEAAGTRAKSYLYVKPNVGAGETAWTITPGAADDVIWSVLEVQNLDLITPADVVTSATVSSGTTLSTGTTATSTTYDAMVVALFAHSVTDATPPTITGHTDSFVEVASSSRSATDSLGHSVAVKYTQALGTFTGSATSSVTASATHLGIGVVAVLSAQGAKRTPDLDQLWGMEWGTTAGLGTGNAGNRVFETVNGSPAVTTSTPRTGTYCLELSASAAIENVQGAQVALSGVTQAPVVRVCFRFPTSLPAGDVDVFSVRTSADTTVWFRSATGKLGVKVATGTEVASDAVVTADTWICVDLVVYDAGAQWQADWQVDYGDGVPVTQTQATFTTGSTLGAGFIVALGWLASATATVRYDDVVASKTKGHYPLGDHQVRVLKVDPAATPTVSGSATSFSTFTDNGTINSTFSATTARDAIDELPPTIGATADGFCQDATAANDYVELPMQTYQAAPSGSIRAVRMLACGWAASGTAATIGFRGWNGTAATTLLSTIDPAFDASTTDPAWVCKMYKPTGGWTQAQLDALAFRVGFSDDAAPDIGIHAIYAEVAVQPTQQAPLFGAAGAVPRVEARTDPTTGGIIALDTWTAAGQALEITYELNGTPTTYTAPADSAPHTQTVDAPDFPTTNWISARLA